MTGEARWGKSMLLLKSFPIASLVVMLSILGCARAARDTTGFAMSDSATVGASFEDAWQAVKAVLRERGLEIYTRDKRGLFVAYSNMRRHILVPHRTKYTIELSQLSDHETGVNIETLREVYGVTLLTYPNWHARKATDNSEALAILEALQAKLAAPQEEAPIEAADAPPAG